jgi:P pilus assembly chaperone PapD
MNAGRIAAVALALGVGARAAHAQIAVDELELKLQLDQHGAASVETFRVSNTGDAPVQATISAQDWDRAENGDNRFYALNTLPTSCGKRLKVFPMVLQLAAHATQTVRVSMDSAQAAPNGCHTVLFVEQPPPPKNQRASALLYTLRYGVKVYAEPANGAASGEVKDMQIVRDSVVLQYANGGAVQSQTHGTVEIRRPDNSVAAKVDVPEFPVLGGASRRLAVALPKLASGKYVVLALLDFGGAEIAAGQAELQVP